MRLLLNPLDHIKNVQLLIVEFISFNFKPTFIKLWIFVEPLAVCTINMSLMAKVNHLAWFKGPIFQEAYLESTLPLEIPTAYSYRSLCSQLRSCISSIFKIESRGLLIVENDIWRKSWQSFEHHFPRGPLNAVVPSICITIYIFKKGSER